MTYRNNPRVTYHATLIVQSKARGCDICKIMCITWGSSRVSFKDFFLLCSQSGNYPENDLAKFGYILDMKVEEKKNPSIFLATYWNLALKSGDLRKKNSSNSGKFVWVFFLH